MYSRNTKTTNEPTASKNKSDKPRVEIWDTWKTLKYLNINENRKDVDRYKFVVLFLLIVVLFDFLNIKSAIPYICSTTLLLYKLETNEFYRIRYNGILFPHSYSGDGLGATHLGLHLSTHVEKETRYIKIRAASFVSIVLYPILI